ncbi:phosphonate ABC transporter, permease protein PhnE [Caldicellulosiruptor morganii]|uniref:Phosphonate ABC transporter, permease protein PhnE n=1 Tax=Caldicellulosiruptor morganii TaxID=1387555 RepID=A0ABY7BLV8_9FIRM|nr:phosphonate ABC transporter, permease protein PhnE [Caldicellulosiruptor morganii]WAM33485.1 phosphonate ABC transporter, permease protein PhnE [Caldicellulosiruptor morganii]
MKLLTDDFKTYSRRKLLKRLLIFIIFLSLTIWSAINTKFYIINVISNLNEVYRFLFKEMLVVNFSVILNITKYTVETIIISYVATMFSILISFIFALLSASTTSPFPFFMTISRAIAAILRTVPDVVWVIILVPAYGIGSMTGTIALFLTSTGFLVKSFSEVLESIDLEKLNAIRACGASWLQIIGRGVMPQFFPGLISWSFFGFDTNVRSSFIIGMVGGGGLGFLLQFGLKLYRFEIVTMTIILMALLFMFLDYVSNFIRRRVLK